MDLVGMERTEHDQSVRPAVAPQDVMAALRVLEEQLQHCAPCRVHQPTRTHARTCTHTQAQAQAQHAHTHTRTHARTRAHTCTDTNAHTCRLLQRTRCERDARCSADRHTSPAQPASTLVRPQRQNAHAPVVFSTVQAPAWDCASTSQNDAMYGLSTRSFPLKVVPT